MKEEILKKEEIDRIEVLRGSPEAMAERLNEIIKEDRFSGTKLLRNGEEWVMLGIYKIKEDEK